MWSPKKDTHRLFFTAIVAMITAGFLAFTLSGLLMAFDQSPQVVAMPIQRNPEADAIRDAIAIESVAHRDEWRNHDAWPIALESETKAIRTRPHRVRYAASRLISFGFTQPRAARVAAATRLVDRIELHESHPAKDIQAVDGTNSMHTSTRHSRRNEIIDQISRLGSEPEKVRRIFVSELLPEPLDVYRWGQARFDSAERMNAPINEMDGSIYRHIADHFNVTKEEARLLYLYGGYLSIK